MCGYDTTGGVWGYWTTGTSSSTCATYTWGYWTGNCNNSATTTATGGVWFKWVATSSQTCGTSYRYIPPEPTAEELAERKKRQAEAKAAEAERKKKEEEADKRAEELLVAQLDGEQRKQYRRDRTFFMRARDGRRYHVRRGWSGHVSRVDDAGKELERFCIHPRVCVPLPDNQLVAKLMLETDPEMFLKTANRHAVPAMAG